MFHWKKHEKPTGDLPSPYAEPERYKGRPLLVILDNYVLDCIGELTPEQQQGLARLVKPVFGGGDDWKKTMRDVLHLEDSIDQQIKQMWEANKIKAKEMGTELHPVQYAKMFVDSNFAHLITQDRN